MRQLERGLVLVKREGIPFEIDTFYGTWKVVEGVCPYEEWQKVMKSIQIPLGLSLFKEEIVNRDLHKRAYYAITEWEGQEIKWPSYKFLDEYMSHEKVKLIWEEFSNHRSF